MRRDNSKNTIMSVLLAIIISMIIVWSGAAYKIGKLLGRNTVWILAIITPILAIIYYIVKTTKSQLKPQR